MTGNDMESEDLILLREACGPILNALKTFRVKASPMLDLPMFPGKMVRQVKRMSFLISRGEALWEGIPDIQDVKLWIAETAAHLTYLMGRIQTEIKATEGLLPSDQMKQLSNEVKAWNLGEDLLHGLMWALEEGGLQLWLAERAKAIEDLKEVLQGGELDVERDLAPVIASTSEVSTPADASKKLSDFLDALPDWPNMLEQQKLGLVAHYALCALCARRGLLRLHGSYYYGSGSRASRIVVYEDIKTGKGIFLAYPAHLTAKERESLANWCIFGMPNIEQGYLSLS